MQTTDDLGFKVELEGRPRRIVSLVPSWTETLFALGLDREIVGVTRFCAGPGDRQCRGEPARGYRAPARAGGRSLHYLSAQDRNGGRVDSETWPRGGARNRSRHDGAPDCAFRERNRDRQRDVEQASFSRLLSDLEKPVDGIQRRHVCA